MTLLEEKSIGNCENDLVKIIEAVNNLYTLKKNVLLICLPLLNVSSLSLVRLCS